ncbi:MAG: efflux RND transporter periplasmic adaptor subunit [Alphaproteobacteria bacterium]|nr:efflux RND transporter periplasmic adaptor subunit [Alphaproteobacteria bacterium]
MRKILPIVLFSAFALPALAAEYKVETVAIDDMKAVFATVESTDVIPARARIGGTIGGLVVDEGAMVKAGERIALIGDAKLGIEAQAHEARIASAAAERDKAKLDMDRATKLLATGAVSQARLDHDRTQYEIAQRQVSALQSERAVVVQRSNEGAVLAPANGRVLKVNVTNGSVVMPGEPVATIALENYLLRILLPERHARFLRVGTLVRVAERGDKKDGDSLREGEVVHVYPQIDNGRVVADVKVDGLSGYFVGERARVYISTGVRDGFLVPADFLFRRFGLTYAKLKDGPELVVQPGQTMQDGTVEILSGLKSGDILVTP